MEASGFALVDFTVALWVAVKVAVWLVSLFFSLAGAFTWYEGRKPPGSQKTGNELIPLVFGGVAWVGALLFSYAQGGNPWITLAACVAFCLLGIAAGNMGTWVYIPAALVCVGVWLTWPGPKYYAVAFKDMAMEGVSQRISAIWNAKVEAVAEPQQQSPEVVHLMKSGLDAARRKNWAEAILSFRRAHGLSWDYPEALYNLALAHDHAGNHLVATCWYEAFLRLAPPSRVRTATEARLASLDEELRSGLSILTSATLEISATEVGGHKWGDLQTIAVVEAEFGNVPRALEALERLRQIDPNDQNWSGSCLLVAYSFVEQGLIGPAEFLAGRIQPGHAALLRRKISGAWESGAGSASGGSFSTLSDAEAVRLWGEYADGMPNSSHHRWHAFDYFSIDVSSSPSPSPEMGISPYIAGLQSRKEYRASALLDGVKRLYLTHREMRRRTAKLVRPEETGSPGKAPTLSEIVDKYNRFFEQVKQSAKPGTFIE